MISAVPSFVSAHPAHLDLALARRSRGDRWLCAQADALVDLGHRLATSASEPLRPRGLALLTRLVETLGDARDPDVPGSALLEQFQAQVLSALRAAAAAVTAVTDGDGDSGESSSAGKSTPRLGVNASSVADPASVLEALSLASASLVDGRVTGGDPAATRRSSTLSSGRRRRRSRPIGRRRVVEAAAAVEDHREVAGGDVAGVGVTATHAPARSRGAGQGERRRASERWSSGGAGCSRDAIARANGYRRDRVARDLARASGPALGALASSSSSSSSSSVFDACAAAFRAAAASGSFPSRELRRGSTDSESLES